MKNNMNHMKHWAAILLLLICGISLASCEKEDDYELAKYLKKTYGPMVVGEKYDFSFSMASTDGTSLKDVKIEATYPGSEGTKLDTYCYWTLLDGKDYKKEMITGVSTNGNTTTAQVIDGIEWEKGNASGYSSQAITLRYSYVIPEEARGQNVQFRVTFTNKNGSVNSYSTLNYQVENMDIKKDVVLSDGDCFSLAEMKVYKRADVVAQNKSAAIDFVYRYTASSITTPGGNSLKLNHCIAAPAHPVYMNTSYVPADWTKNATLIESRKWDDAQLKGNTPNNYVTDLDIRSNAPNGQSFGAYDLKNDFGLLIQSVDGTYRAYLYVKKTDNAGKITIGIKRLKIK